MQHIEEQRKDAPIGEDSFAFAVDARIFQNVEELSTIAALKD